MSEMGSHDPFGHLKHKLWSKERPKVKLAVWLPTTKVRNQPDFLACRWHNTYHWKALDKGYNFSLDLISIEGLQIKLWAPKVARVPNGSPKTKSHLDVAPVEKCRIYYKRESDGFPQVRAVVSLMSPSCPWLVLAPKVLQICLNHLVLVLVQVRVSNWNLSILPSPKSHPRALAHPSTPPKCCEPRNMPRLFTLPMFSVWDSHLSPSRN
jgi:hypothetical protein